VNNILADSALEMRDAVLRCLSDATADIYISAAAISDFAPHKIKGKLRSGKPATLHLEPLPKLLDDVIKDYHPLTIAFKLGRNQKKPAQHMIDHGIDIVLVNAPETMGSKQGEYILLTKKTALSLKGTKDEIAVDLWSYTVQHVL
jgi:phosphopantothenoylcysteine decarboxylase/phosphopantothenate--cysteine ligase